MPASIGNQIISSLYVIVCGGQGGTYAGTCTTSSCAGGYGGCVETILAVKPNQVIFLNVGGGARGNTGSIGGYNGMKICKIDNSCISW